MAARTKGGRFQKGVSGNPKGKPKGTKHRLTLMAEQLAEGDVKAIMAKVVSMAKAGDPAALKLILPRLWPAPRTPAVTFELGDTNTPDALAEATDRILAAVSEGRLSPEQARDVSALLNTKRQLIETTELARRIEELEQSLKVSAR